MKYIKLMLKLLLIGLIFLMSTEARVMAADVTLTGYVMKSDGKTPLAGVNVVASLESGNNPKTATTLADGKFIFTNLEGGTYSLMAFNEGYIASTKSNISVAENKLTENINILLFQSGSISGKVTEVDGITPICEAKVVLYDINRIPVTSTGSNDTGKYILSDLLPGTYGIGVEKSGYPAGGKGPIEVAEGQKIDELNFILSLGVSISGKVLDKNTEHPISGAFIMPIFGNKIYGINQTNMNGEYSISDLPQGHFTFVVKAQNYVDLTEELIISGNEIKDFHLQPSK